MKKIMQLGANYFQSTVIKAAKELGHHVITVDYSPDNPGHKFSDEYHNVSTIDTEGVLALAQKLKIDGIISYASDVSAPTAAFVAEKMGLPTNPLEAVTLMTRKDSTRRFLKEHGFNVPINNSFSQINNAIDFFISLSKPMMVKPVDSNGSKGVTKVENESEFKAAFEKAMSFSRQKRIIVEEFISRKGYQVAGDSFLSDGKIVYSGFMNEHFDKLCNPLVPIGESFPSILSDELKQKATNEIQRFMQLLGMRFGPINMDFIIDEKDNVYIIEIGPRSGGNWITDAIAEATGVNLAQYLVQASLGENTYIPEEKNNGFVASYIIHSLRSGTLQGIEYSMQIKDDIISNVEFSKSGDFVEQFNNAALGIGVMLFRSSSIEEMCYRLDNMERFIQVKTI